MLSYEYTQIKQYNVLYIFIWIPDLKVHIRGRDPLASHLVGWDELLLDVGLGLHLLAHPSLSLGSVVPGMKR